MADPALNKSELKKNVAVEYVLMLIAILGAVWLFLEIKATHSRIIVPTWSSINPLIRFLSNYKHIFEVHSHISFEGI